MKKFSAACLAVIGLAVSATAMSAATEMDSDGDGFYSFSELLVGFPTLTEETYLLLDANGDGSVDAEEVAAAQQAGIIPAS